MPSKFAYSYSISGYKVCTVGLLLMIGWQVVLGQVAILKTIIIVAQLDIIKGSVFSV